MAATACASRPLLMNVPGGSSGRVLSPQATLLPLQPEPAAPALPSTLPKVAIFEDSNSSSNYESAGWLRWVFDDRWNLPSITVSPADVAAGALAAQDVDVLVVPNMYVPTIVQKLGKEGKRPTLLYNGYGDFVAGLYKDMKLTKPGD